MIIVKIELARALCPLGIPPLKGVPFLNKSFRQITIIITRTKIERYRKHFSIEMLSFFQKLYIPQEEH